jgi:hypothetical protein
MYNVSCFKASSFNTERGEDIKSIEQFDITADWENFLKRTLRNRIVFHLCIKLKKTLKETLWVLNSAGLV